MVDSGKEIKSERGWNLFSSNIQIKRAVVPENRPHGCDSASWTITGRMAAVMPYLVAAGEKLSPSWCVG